MRHHTMESHPGGHPLLQDSVDGFVAALDELSANRICSLGAGICEGHDAGGDMRACQGSHSSPRGAAWFVWKHFQWHMESWTWCGWAMGYQSEHGGFWYRFFQGFKDSSCVLSTNRWQALLLKIKKKAKNLSQLAQNLIWLYFSTVIFLVKPILLYFLPCRCISFHTCS